MEVEIDLRKTVAENAQSYYARSKKLKRKIDGIRRAISDAERKLDEEPGPVTVEKTIEKRKSRRWYEKFRWFKSTQDLLVIGGRDATSNEVLIKKHLEQNDLVFHANIQGAPFFIVKGGAQSNEATKRQAASAAAAYSKAWSKGYGSIDVYHIGPDQVSKTPPTGEYLTKGAFMVYGEKTWHKNVELGLALGICEGEVIGGPEEAIRHHAKAYVAIGIGQMSQGKAAKKVRAILGEGDLDEIQRFLPAGGSAVRGD